MSNVINDVATKRAARQRPENLKASDLSADELVEKIKTMDGGEDMLAAVAEPDEAEEVELLDYIPFDGRRLDFDRAEEWLHPNHRDYVDGYGALREISSDPAVRASGWLDDLPYYRVGRRGVEIRTERLDAMKNRVGFSYHKLTKGGIRINGALEGNGEGESHGRWVTVYTYDSNGRKAYDHHVDSRTLSNKNKLMEWLSDAGVYCEQGDLMQIRRFLAGTALNRTVACVDRTGWRQIDDDWVFVLPHRSLCGANAELANTTVLARGDGKIPKPEFEPRGTFEGWLGTAKLLSDQPLAVFAMCSVLASPCLDVLGEDGFALHLVGSSSVGKTTVAQVAASVCGPWSSLKGSWRSTENGMEAAAASRNHLALFLDEIGEASSPEVVGKMIYSLTNSTSKQRMRHDRVALREMPKALLVVVSTGEKTLKQVLSGSRTETTAGQEARFLNMPADAGAGHGIWSRLPTGFAGGAQFSDYLKVQFRENCGHALPQLLQHLSADQDRRAGQLRQAQDAFMTSIATLLERSDGQVERVARKFATIYAAGVLAVRGGALPFDEADILSSASFAFRGWLSLRGHAGDGESRAALEAVLKAVERDRAKFPLLEPRPLGMAFGGQFANDSGTVKSQDSWGFRQRRFDGNVAPSAGENNIVGEAYAFSASALEALAQECGQSAAKIRAALTEAGAVLDSKWHPVDRAARRASEQMQTVKVDGITAKALIVDAAMVAASI